MRSFVTVAAVVAALALMPDMEFADPAPQNERIILVLFGGILAGAAKALVSDLVPSHLVALAYGGYAAAIGVATLPASLVAGVLWEGVGGWGGFGPAAPFAFGATTAVMATALLLATVPRDRGGTGPVRSGGRLWR